jgi:hypothetical protein
MPPPTPTTLPPILLTPSPFRERILLFLLPYFTAVTHEFEVAREEIFETLASYGVRTRPELIHAARVIAFSFSALDMLADAKSSGMSPSMRLRFRGCANGLNRSCQQDEQRLARRLTCDPPKAAKPTTNLTDDIPDAEFEAAIQQAEAKIASYRNRLSGARPAASPQPAPGSRHERRAGIMMNVLADLGMPTHPTAAI